MSMKTLMSCTLAAAAASTWPMTASACRCVEPRAPAAYAHAEAVATVRVSRVVALPDGVVEADADVLKSWKAGLPRSIHLVTGDCAYPMSAGETHLLYLSRGRTDGEWATYRCRGNLPEPNAAERLRWLGRHGTPAADAVDPARTGKP
jgi:hypothetical protein